MGQLEESKDSLLPSSSQSTKVLCALRSMFCAHCFVHCAVLFSMPQHSLHAMHCAAQSSTVLYGAVLCYIAQYCAVQCHNLLCCDALDQKFCPRLCQVYNRQHLWRILEMN